MIYNIDGNVLDSPYSLFLSTLLCLGVFSLGNIIQYFIIKKNFFSNYKEINYFFSPIIGTYFLILFLYYVVIFEINSNLIFKSTSYLLIFLSFLSLNKLIKFYKDIKIQLNADNKLYIYILITIYRNRKQS